MTCREFVLVLGSDLERQTEALAAAKERIQVRCPSLTRAVVVRHARCCNPGVPQNKIIFEFTCLLCDISCKFSPGVA